MSSGSYMERALAEAANVEGYTAELIAGFDADNKEQAMYAAFRGIAAAARGIIFGLCAIAIELPDVGGGAPCAS